MVEVVVRGVRKQRKSAPSIPRAWRWTMLKQAGNKSLVKVIYKEEEFNFCSYILLLKELAHLFCSTCIIRRTCYLLDMHRLLLL